MPNAIRGLTTVQWALETVKGTDLPTTSKMVVEEFSPAPEDARYAPRILNGVLLPNTGNEFAITRGARWRATGPFAYENAHHWMEGCVQGAVTPTGGPTYLWTHTRAATTLPVLDSYTFERSMSDGSATIAEAWHYGMIDQFTLTGAPRGVVMFEASGFARRGQTEALTGGQVLPATELMSHGSSVISIDSTWANRGVTPIVAQLLDWKVTIRPGIFPFFTADGRADLDFGTTALNSDTVGVELEATMLIPGTGSQYAIEKTAAEAQTLRAVELKVTGTSPRIFKLQFLAKHEQATVSEVGTQDGQMVVTLKLVQATDQTNYMAALVTNSVATDA